VESCKKSKSSEKALPLSRLRAGQRGVVVSVKPGREIDFDKLRAFGLIPGAPFLIERTFPALALRLPYASLFLDDELAAVILVNPTESPNRLRKGRRTKKKFVRSFLYAKLKQYLCHK